MRLLIFTSNALRHKYVANMISAGRSDTLVVSECKPLDDAAAEVRNPSLQERHFALREERERADFGAHIAFQAPTLPILHGELNAPAIYRHLKAFNPEAACVFGASIIREPLLSLIPRGAFLNLHLGLSPYYRGSGTNFFPFVNDELEYVGATLLHIDAGVDTGDIIAHVRPSFTPDDTVHSAGNKTIIAAARLMRTLVDDLAQGKTLPRTPQWRAENERYYRKRDFTDETLKRYYENMENGMVARYCEQPSTPPDLLAYPRS